MRQDLLDLRARSRDGNRHGRPSVDGRAWSLSGNRRSAAARPFRASVPLRRRVPVDAAAARSRARRGRGRADRGADRGPRTARAAVAVAAGSRACSSRSLLEPPVETARLPELSLVAGQAGAEAIAPVTGLGARDQAPERHPGRRPQGSGHPRRGARRPRRARDRDQRQRRRARTYRRGSTRRATSLLARDGERDRPRRAPRRAARPARARLRRVGRDATGT